MVFHCNGRTILHHFPGTYNLFLKISVPHKFYPFPGENYVIFPGDIKKVLCDVEWGEKLVFDDFVHTAFLL